MATWPAKQSPEETEMAYPVNPGNPYANVPSSPSLSPLPPQQESVRPVSPLVALNGQGSRMSNYVSSPLNPNASIPSRSRPSSWGGNNAMDKLSNESRGGAEGSGSGSSASSGERDTLRGIASGTVGAGFGPYSVGPLRASFSVPTTPHNRFSTLSSVGSVISLSSDSKYPVGMYGGNSHSSGAFLPYSDNPNIDYGQDHVDEDDALHEPDPPGHKDGMGGWSWRGFFNIVLVFAIIGALVTLFAGYPVISYFQNTSANLGVGRGVNGTGQAAQLTNMPKLIDSETPEEAKTRTGVDGEDYVLVFSDEFNTDGRSFYPGDDPFWEAVDINYWATKDLEWYDPSQITTQDGALVITLDQIPNHDLFYKSGMLQSWNKFCFTGGYVEVAVTFPGNSGAQGYWPGAWTMGNLGRPGYGASTHGVWPYSYSTCDVGTYPNQTRPDGTPVAAATGGKSKFNYNLSWLPGQKLSACTCKGEEHPGPDVSVGRGAPEIDLFEAEKSKVTTGGATSQSSQFAPFSAGYQFPNTSEYVTIKETDRTALNDFKGSGTQQSVSCLTQMDESWFQLTGEQYAVFGVEWHPDQNKPDNGYINWVSGGRQSWGVKATAVGPDLDTEIGQRLVSEEPMAMVLNLAISESFQSVSVPTLHFPAIMKFDYVRVYQRTDSVNIGCDPKDRPTSQYISDHLNAYTNPNLTDWASAGYNFPKNSMRDNC